jgi:putative NIF3 family GTP cyclohydrolase 1 type 2
MKLKEITKTLDEFFQLNALDMDPSMKNFIPMVYDPIGFKRKNFFEKDFCSRFNGLMIKGWEEVNTIFLSVFPSEEVLENFIKKSQAGDLLFLHHPIFMSSWDPKGNTWTFFHPIDPKTLKKIKDKQLSIYSCHAPMDTNNTIGTGVAIIEALWGKMTKEEVRELAKKIWLPNADRKDSQWLCFIWKVPMKDFLKKRLQIKKWDIVLLDGTKVWEHEWAYFFTIGQSRGLDINKKAYVVKIDVKKNLVFVSYEKFEPELVSKEIKVSNWHWIGKEYSFPLDCSTKIRYRQEPQEAKLLESKVESRKLKVIYEEEQWGIAPGQTLTAYIDDECVGSGIIDWV